MILVNKKYKIHIKYAQHSCFTFSRELSKMLMSRVFSPDNNKTHRFLPLLPSSGGEKSTLQFVSPSSEKVELKNFQVTEKV